MKKLISATSKITSGKLRLFPAEYCFLATPALAALLFTLAGTPSLALAGSDKYSPYFNTDANKAAYLPAQDTGNKFDAAFTVSNPAVGAGLLDTGARLPNSISDTKNNALGIAGMSQSELTGICEKFGVGGSLAVADQVAGQQTAAPAGGGTNGLQQVALAVRTDPQAFTHMLSGPVTQAAGIGRISGAHADNGQQEDTALVSMNFLSAVTGASADQPEAAAPSDLTAPALKNGASPANEGTLQAGTATKKSSVGIEAPSLIVPGQAAVIDGAPVLTALDKSEQEMSSIASGHRKVFTNLRGTIHSAMDPKSSLRPEARIQRLEKDLATAKQAADHPDNSEKSEKAESKQIVIGEAALYKLYESLDPATAKKMQVDKKEKLAEIKEDMEEYAAICQDASLNSFVSDITRSSQASELGIAVKTDKGLADKKQNSAASVKSASALVLPANGVAKDTGKTDPARAFSRTQEMAKPGAVAVDAKAGRAALTAVEGRPGTGVKISGQTAGQAQAKTADVETLQTRAQAAEDVKKASVNGEALKKSPVNNVLYGKKEPLSDTDKKKILEAVPGETGRREKTGEQPASQIFKAQDLQPAQGVNAGQNLNLIRNSGSLTQSQSEKPARTGEAASAMAQTPKTANAYLLDLSNGKPTADAGILRSVDSATLGRFQAALTAGSGTPEFKELTKQYQAVVKTIEGNLNDRRALHLALLYAGAIYALDPDAQTTSGPEQLKTDAATAGNGQRSDANIAAAVTAALNGDSAQLTPLFNLGVKAVSLDISGNQATASETESQQTGSQAPKVLAGPGSESYAVRGSALEGISVKVRLGLSEKTFTLTRASDASLIDRWTKAGDPDNALKASPHRDLIAYECLISKDWSAGSKAMVNAYLSTNGRPRRAKLGASEM